MFEITKRQRTVPCLSQGQIIYLNYSAQPAAGEWFNNSSHSGYFLQFNDFKTSKSSVDFLTQVFLWSYERPSIPHLNQRIEYANYWYNYFS